MTVVWEIEVDADTHEDAAREAQRIQRDPASTANVFVVYGEHGPGRTIDLDNR